VCKIIKCKAGQERKISVYNYPKPQAVRFCNFDGLIDWLMHEQQNIKIYSDRIFPMNVGSMGGNNRQRYAKYFAIYSISRGLAITEAEERFKFYINKV